MPLGKEKMIALSEACGPPMRCPPPPTWDPPPVQAAMNGDVVAAKARLQEAKMGLAQAVNDKESSIRAQNQAQELGSGAENAWLEAATTPEHTQPGDPTLTLNNSEP